MSFELHPQGIRDPVDVIEVASDRRGVKYLFVGEAAFPQPPDLGLGDGGGILGDSLRIFQDGQTLGIKRGLPVILGELLDQRSVFRLSTESLSVMNDSIMTVVGHGDDQGDHLPLGSTQRGRPVHEGVE